jgi:hypothetical protein
MNLLTKSLISKGFLRLEETIPKISLGSNFGADAPFSKLFSVGFLIFLINFFVKSKASFSFFC